MSDLATFDASTLQAAINGRVLQLGPFSAAIHGRWAALAREDSLRGDIAFAEMVPRAHPEGLDDDLEKRWRVPACHVGWHAAARLYRNLNVITAVDMGKSEVFTLCRMAKKIGLRPDLHRAILSQADTEAVRRVKAVRELLESKDYRAVFPHIRPASGTAAKWADHEFNVHRPNVGDANPTLRAASVDGKGLGARIHDLVIDDAITEKTTRTAEERDSKTKRIRGTFISRVLKWGTVVNVQNAWHQMDLGHVLQQEGWPTIIQGAKNPDGSYRWPERWDDAYYAKKQKEIGFILSPGLLDCRPRSDISGRFTEEWARKALQAGLGRQLIHKGRASGDYALSVGCDPAHKKVPGRGDRAAIVTLLGDGEVSWTFVWGERDSKDQRWGGHGTADRMRDHRQRYPDARLFVEDNGGQALLVEFMQDTTASIQPVNTGSDKTDPQLGIIAMFSEMASGEVGLPCSRVSQEGEVLSFDAPEIIREFLAQCFDYDPGKHTGDLLMATWIAWKGLRSGSQKIEQIAWRRR